MSDPREAPPPPPAYDPDHGAAAAEMANLPRDFLSLRPQQQQQQQQQQGQSQQNRQQQQQQAVPSHAVKQEFQAVSCAPPPKVSPLAAAPALQSKCSVYPKALATHEEVVADKSLFLDTLRRLHGSLGFRSLTIPTIGGTQLDLHLLYKEVTARGGLLKVIKERIWKEIKAAFRFPPTTTNASFVLRKYYTSLLHHYEQVYFFRNEGNLILAQGDTTTTTATVSSTDVPSDDSDAIRRRKPQQSYEAADPLPVAVADAANCIGQMVTGSIDGKFEHGYLVSVTVGSEKLKGVLYNVPPGEFVPQFTATAKAANGGGVQTAPSASVAAPAAATAEEEAPRKRRRRLGLRKKDPNAPKLNRSAYNFFFAEQRARIRVVQPNKEISRMIGDSWSKLTAEQRQPYQERGIIDKERYRKEIKLYRDRLKQQALPNESSTVVEEVHDEGEDSEDAEEPEPEESNGDGVLVRHEPQHQNQQQQTQQQQQQTSSATTITDPHAQDELGSSAIQELQPQQEAALKLQQVAL